MNFWLLPAIHLLAVMSPGPDFFLILEHSLTHSRRGSLISAFGIASGCLIHMTTVIIILFFLETQVEWVSKILRILGAGYLILLGVSSFKMALSGWLGKSSKPVSLQMRNNLQNSSSVPLLVKEKIHFSEFKTYFLKGFFCNLLNPKAWAYFSSIFMVISSQFSQSEILLLVFLFYIITQSWFSLVTVFFTLPTIKSSLEKYQVAMSLLCGITFCFLGISLALEIDTLALSTGGIVLPVTPP